MIYPLSTQRLSIRPLALSDLEAFVSYRQDPDVARYQSWETSFSHEQGKALIQSQDGIELPAPGEWLQLAVHELSTGQLVGDVALHQLAAPREFEIGFTLATAHQGKGYAFESTSRLLEFLINEIWATKVIATPDSRNAKSISLLSKLGFTRNSSKCWVEEFKGETVTVEYFELESPKA